MGLHLANRQLRNAVRVLHLAVGVSLALLVYSPLQDNAAFVALNQFVAVPLASLTGLALWQQPKLAAWLRRK